MIETAAAYAPWKVPFREVYCTTFPLWVRETLWCHVVIRLFPRAIDVPSLDDCCAHDAPKGTP